MAKETLSQANKRMREEVRAAIERARTLVAEHNEEALDALVSEAKETIGKLPARERDKLTNELREASTIPSTLATLDYHSIPGMDELVNAGTERVKEAAAQDIKAGESMRALAAHVFDMHRRCTTKEGLPDLLARSQAARDASGDMYAEARKALAGDEMDQQLHIESIEGKVQYQRPGVISEYVYALDNSPEEAEYFRAATDAYPGLSVSEAVFKHYEDHKMSLPRESSQAIKKRKREEKKRLQEEGAPREQKALEPPAARARAAIEGLGKAAHLITPEEAEALPPETKKELLPAAEKRLAEYKALVASLL